MRIWRVLIVTMLVAGLMVACGDDDDEGPDRDVGVDTGPADADQDVGADAEPDARVATSFTVTVENTSDEIGFPVPLSPGVFAVHSTDDPLFTTGQPDRGEGLEALAEDGQPSMLAANLPGDADIAASGTFSGNGGIAPGDTAQFAFEAAPGDGNLSLATMFVPSNDVFLSPDGQGIALFGDDGTPLDERQITDQLQYWEAGTERNEAPGQGPNQPDRQDSPDSGPAEGVVSLFDNTTRAIPAGGIVEVDVSESGGTYTISVANVSVERGAITTPISPVYWAVHDASVALFETGSAASEGLESLAEDGSATVLVNATRGADGFQDVGAQPITLERPNAQPGPAAPGETYEFQVTPDADHPLLSLASMVVQSNDAFLAPVGGGIALLDDAGQPRPAEDVAAAIARRMAVWDAGTEANEVPGVGANQAPRQPAPDTGADDPNDAVRLYADPTNDLAGPAAGGFVDVSITRQSGNTFEVTVTNTSGSTVYPGVITPVVWTLHEEAMAFFEVGQPASEGLESLAEDGDPGGLVDELSSAPDVLDSQVVNIPDGTTTSGPLDPGESFSFSATPDTDHRFLSLAAMVVPSNDTFLAFDPSGIALLDDTGSPRSEADIAADVENTLRAWDAGTEANQAGAAGPDQAPRQAAPNTGPEAGDGTVRLLMDPVWTYPPLSDVVRITISPQ